jgi:hypothetical protein
MTYPTPGLIASFIRPSDTPRRRRAYGLLDSFLSPDVLLASTGGGPAAASAAGVPPMPPRPLPAYRGSNFVPVRNFRRLERRDFVTGKRFPVIVDEASNQLHPYVAGLIDQLVSTDPDSKPAVQDARLDIDRLFAGEPRTLNWFHYIFSDYLSGDLTPEEAAAYMADRGDERLRENRRAAAQMAPMLDGLAAASARPLGYEPIPVRPVAPGNVPGRREQPGQSGYRLPEVSYARNPMTAEEFATLPLRGSVDPSRIRTMQDNIGRRFKREPDAMEGRSLVSTIDALRSGRTMPENTPEIRVTVIDGKVWTLDHRRLVAAREAGVPVRYRKVPANELLGEIKRKSTTEDDGMSIVIKLDESE